MNAGGATVRADEVIAVKVVWQACARIRRMPRAILNSLRFDHRLFAALLDAAETQVQDLRERGIGDLALLRSIARYFETYPGQHHHPFEEVIYGHLLCQMPSF